MDNWGGRQSRKTIKWSGDLLSGASCEHHTQAKPEALRFLLLNRVCRECFERWTLRPSPQPSPRKNGP